MPDLDAVIRESQALEMYLGHHQYFVKAKRRGKTLAPDEEAFADTDMTEKYDRLRRLRDRQVEIELQQMIERSAA